MLEHFHGKDNKMKNRKKIFIIIAVLSTFCFSICGCSKDKDKIFIMIALLSTFCLPYVDAVKIRTRIYPKNSYTPLFVISICKA